MTFEEFRKQRKAKLGSMTDDEEIRAEWAIWEAIEAYSWATDSDQGYENEVKSAKEAVTKAIDDYRVQVWGDGYGAGCNACS